nr:hypothetical protein Iba_chr13cCG9580 [Ipomoea batatas]
MKAKLRFMIPSSNVCVHGIQGTHFLLLYQVQYIHVMVCWCLLVSPMVQLEYLMQTVSGFGVELQHLLIFLRLLAAAAVLPFP